MGSSVGQESNEMQKKGWDKFNEMNAEINEANRKTDTQRRIETGQRKQFTEKKIGLKFR